MDRQKALSILNQIDREKQANQAQQDAASDVGKATLWGAGAGLAIGGAGGLYTTVRNNLKKKKQTRHMAVVPIPVREEDDKEKKAGFLDGLKGDYATTKDGVPWRLPAMYLGGVAGLYGGWKGVDALMSKQRSRDIDDELQQARNEFALAMMPPKEDDKKTKAAADNIMVKVSEDLSELFALLEKAASWGLSPDTWGQLGGAYGMYAAPTALVAGVAAYNAGKKRQRAKILADAIKQRALRRQAQQPAELYAMPMSESDLLEEE